MFCRDRRDLRLLLLVVGFLSCILEYRFIFKGWGVGFFMGSRLQYSVVLTEGLDKELRRWVWVDRAVFDSALENIGRDGDYQLGSSRCLLDKKDIIIVSENEVNANTLAKRFNFPEPFLRVNGDYVLNRYGE